MLTYLPSLCSENLVGQFQSMLEFESADRSGKQTWLLLKMSRNIVVVLIPKLALGNVYVPPNRLVTLLRQAVAYQIQFSRYHPKIAPAVNSHVFPSIFQSWKLWQLLIMKHFVDYCKTIPVLSFLILFDTRCVGMKAMSNVSGSLEKRVEAWSLDLGK